MSFNAREFGEMLKALRGAQTQQTAAQGSGVSQGLISSYELGETENPSFLVIARLANHYGITPNVMAALAGIFAEPGTEEDIFAPDVSRAMQAVYTLMLRLETPTKQRRFALMLEAVTKEMQKVAETDSAVLATRLPAYVKRLITSDGSADSPVKRHVQQNDGAIVEEVVEKE